MDFVRKKLRGQNKKVRRTWISDGYRIIWRKEAYGIALPPAFQATVRIALPHGGEMWDFVGRPLFKTMKAAQEACEKHHRLWSKAADVSGIRALHELFGKVPLGYPVWVKPKLNRHVYELLTDTTVRKRKEICDFHPIENTEPSEPSASTMEPKKDDLGPASSVEEKVTSTAGRKRQSSTTAPESSAPAAAETGKARKKRAGKPTGRHSKPTKKKKRTTKGSSASENKPSPSSRKTRKKRSRN